MSGSRSASDKWIARHIAGLPRSGIRDFFDLVNSMEDVVSLGIGEPDFVTPWHIREATIYGLDRGHTSYTSNLGLLQFRRAATDYVREWFGVDYAPESECIATVGVSEALDLALRAILDPGDEVVYHEPCYVSYAPGVRMAHGVPVAVETREQDGFSLDPAALAAAVTPRTKAILLNFPNNPTGADLSTAAKQAIAELAVSRDLLVITDVIYSEITYGERPACMAALPGMRERTILLHGLSKAYAMTGYRIGFACGPAPLIAAMMKVHQYTMLCASRMAQEAAVEAFRHGRAAMERMRTEYEQRRNVIVTRLRDMGLPCVQPRGAFYVFPRIRETGLNSREFAMRLLEEKRVAVVPGSAFGACGEGYIRCSYATALEEIEIAMQRMRAFLESLG